MSDAATGAEYRHGEFSTGLQSYGYLLRPAGLLVLQLTVAVGIIRRKVDAVVVDTIKRGTDSKSPVDAIHRTDLEAGKPARTCPLTDEEKEIVRGWFLLTTKPVIYAANIAEDLVSEDEDSIDFVKQVKAIAQKEQAEVLVISARIEEEIAQMDPAEKEEFLQELGIGQSGLDRLIRKCYHLLGLISFLTAGEDECRAWTITKGTKAPQAAGKIHTDFERGFIRAQTIAFEDFIACKGEQGAKDAGKMRAEGKEYIVQDGDVMNFLFNV